MFSICGNCFTGADTEVVTNSGSYFAVPENRT